jgi:hypothetical protein
MNPIAPEQLELEFETMQPVRKADIVDLSARLNAKRAIEEARLREAILAGVEHLADIPLPKLYK